MGCRGWRRRTSSFRVFLFVGPPFGSAERRCCVAGLRLIFRTGLSTSDPRASNPPDGDRARLLTSSVCVCVSYAEMKLLQYKYVFFVALQVSSRAGLVAIVAAARCPRLRATDKSPLLSLARPRQMDESTAASVHVQVFPNPWHLLRHVVVFVPAPGTNVPIPYCARTAYLRIVLSSTLVILKTLRYVHLNAEHQRPNCWPALSSILNGPWFLVSPV